jgi:hypothetical protein
MCDELPTYPRTLHLGSSGGGTSKHSAPLSDVLAAHIVVEEKVDGSHVGLFFDKEANLVIFHRKSVLSSPPAEPEFQLLHRQAHAAIDALWDTLQTRYVLYGEWALLTHSLFYDALPAYFLEDDLFDRERGSFLSTCARTTLLSDLPPSFSSPVAVLAEGVFSDLFESEAQLIARLGPSLYRSPNWVEAIVGANEERRAQLAMQALAEGLYIKHESDGIVQARYKWIPESFITGILKTNAHWRTHRPLQNQMRGSINN